MISAVPLAGHSKILRGETPHVQREAMPDQAPDASEILDAFISQLPQAHHLADQGSQTIGIGLMLNPRGMHFMSGAPLCWGYSRIGTHFASGSYGRASPRSTHVVASTLVRSYCSKYVGSYDLPAVEYDPIATKRSEFLSSSNPCTCASVARITSTKNYCTCTRMRHGFVA